MNPAAILAMAAFFGGMFLAFLPLLVFGALVLARAKKGIVFYKRYKKLGAVFLIQAVLLTAPIADLYLLDVVAGLGVPYISLVLVALVLISSFWVIKNLFPKLKKEKENKRFYLLAISLQFVLFFYSLLLWFYSMPMIVTGTLADPQTSFPFLLPYILAIIFSFTYTAYCALKWFVEERRSFLEFLVIVSFMPPFVLFVWAVLP